jgi:hypothetical protein
MPLIGLRERVEAFSSYSIVVHSQAYRPSTPGEILAYCSPHLFDPTILILIVPELPSNQTPILLKMPCNVQASERELSLLATVVGIHLRRFLQQQPDHFPTLYADKVSVRQVLQFSRAKDATHPAFLILVSTLRIEKAYLNLRGIEKESEAAGWHQQLKTLGKDPKAGVRHQRYTLPLSSCFSMLRVQLVLWTLGDAPLLQHPLQVARQRCLKQYLQVRASTSRNLFGGWTGVSGCLLAKVWNYASSSAISLSVTQRLVWDKHFHPGHVSLTPTDCPLCQQPFSLAHVI